jgi:hypothetical protein
MVLGRMKFRRRKLSYSVLSEINGEMRCGSVEPKELARDTFRLMRRSLRRKG